MTLRINEERMDCEETGHWAVAHRCGGWMVSWLPDQLVTRHAAITALMLSAAIALDRDRHLWPGFAEELGLRVTEAVALIRQPRRTYPPTQDQDGGQGEFVIQDGILSAAEPDPGPAATPNNPSALRKHGSGAINSVTGTVGTHVAVAGWIHGGISL